MRGGPLPARRVAHRTVTAMALVEASAPELGRLDALSRQGTLVHRIDPRAKLVTTLLYLALVVSFDRYAVSALIGFVVYPVVLCAAGGIPLGYVGKRALLAAPLALMVGAFNPVLDRAPLLSIGSLVLSGGWVSLLSIVLRCWLTVATTLTLIAVTGMGPLCAAMTKLGVPRVFVAQLMFLYRYLFVLLEEAANGARARALRAGGRRGRTLASYGSLLGHLFVRTFARAQRIHQAMSCRGFTGVLPTLDPLRLHARDVAFVIGWGALFGLLRAHNVSLWLGALTAGLLS